jgi:hypothetical protein
MVVSRRVVFSGLAGSSEPPSHVEGVVIEFEEVALTIDLEAAEVVFAVRVVVRGEFVEVLHGQEHASLGADRQFIDALRHDDVAADEDGSEIIVQDPDAVGAPYGCLIHRIALTLG